MKDILIILNKSDCSYSLLPYFLKYKVKNEMERISQPYYVGDVDKSAIDGIFHFLYNGINIKIIFDNNIDITNNGVRECVSRYDYKKYDKVFITINYGSRNFDVKSFENVELLYFKTDENFFETDSEIKNFLSKFRIISNSSISFNHKNFYQEPSISLFRFYYNLAFNYLSYTKLDVNKNNLMGMYYIPRYKNVRDEMYFDLCNIFLKENLEIPTIYDTVSDKPKLITQYLEIHSNNWLNNHSSMYSDYITSVCGFIFDTLNHKSVEGPANSKQRYYINEKVLKSILFSKLNIPFIIDMNPYNFEVLNDLGFWFLNSEFHTFDKDKTEKEKILETRNSIIKSVEYLIDIYKKNNMDLDKTHQELVNLYESKMQNNYNTFIKYLEEPKDNDKLINFILYGN